MKSHLRNKRRMSQLQLQQRNQNQHLHRHLNQLRRRRMKVKNLKSQPPHHLLKELQEVEEVDDLPQDQHHRPAHHHQPRLLRRRVQRPRTRQPPRPRPKTKHPPWHPRRFANATSRACVRRGRRRNRLWHPQPRRPRIASSARFTPDGPRRRHLGLWIGQSGGLRTSTSGACARVAETKGCSLRG